MTTDVSTRIAHAQHTHGSTCAITSVVKGAAQALSKIVIAQHIGVTVPVLASARIIVVRPRQRPGQVLLSHWNAGVWSYGRNIDDDADRTTALTQQERPGEVGGWWMLGEDFTSLPLTFWMRSSRSSRPRNFFMPPRRLMRWSLLALPCLTAAWAFTLAMAL